MMEGVGRRLNTRSGFLLNVGSHSLNGREHNVLFRNNGDQTFSEVGWVNGADRAEDGRGLAVLDSDRDGRLDIVLRNFHQPAGMLRNDGDGTFTDISDSAGVRDGQWGWAAQFLDYDNDGWLDLYAVNGFITGPIEDDL